MIKLPFSKDAYSKRESAPRGSPGKRCYVVGDVHGRLDLLGEILAKLERDNAERPAKDVVLVFLGDLIDRGPDSAGVIDLLLNRPPTFARPFFLKGNHEEMLVRGMSGEPHLLSNWLQHGGLECAQSYGAPIGLLFGAEVDKIEAVMATHIPARHIAFMRGFLDTIQFGDYLFAHAGIQPGVSLEKQGREVRWIRSGFLECTDDLGWVVVHGHTISEEVETRPNRIGLDTGAYRTGKLSALRIEDDITQVIQVCGAAG